jgi:LuxR family maltose regulon positive regulatory protein
MSFTTQGYVKTVEGWMRAIPSGWNSQSPRAYLAFASVYLMRGNYAGVAKNLSQAEPVIFQIQPADHESAETNAMRAEWYSIKANLLNVQGKPVESLETASMALRFTQPGDFYIRGIAYLGLGGAYRLTGDYDQLVGAYQQAIQNSRAAGNSLAEMLAANGLGLMAIQHGQLHFAYQVETEAIDRFEQPGARPPPIAGSVFGVLGLVEYEWNRLENARKYITQALQLIILGGHNAGVVFARIIMARVLQAEGDLPGAARLTQEAVDLLPFGVPPWLKPEVVAQQVRIYLAQNNPVSAEAALKQYQGSGEGPEANLDEPVLLAQLHLALYLAQTGAPIEDLQQAAELANYILAAALDSGRTGNALQALLVRAKIHAGMGNKDASLIDVGEALQLSGSEGYVRTFIDEGPEIAGLLKGCPKQNIATDIVKRLLAAFPVSASSPVADSSGMIEPLSERERQVLGLMAEGLTNPEIAKRLIISLSTVKTHLINIYGKMDVRNRAEAVSRGKELGLL